MKAGEVDTLFLHIKSSAQDFRCEADALLAADRFAKKLKYHCLEAVNLTKKRSLLLVALS
jgi:hypothetical protein